MDFHEKTIERTNPGVPTLIIPEPFMLPLAEQSPTYLTNVARRPFCLLQYSLVSLPSFDANYLRSPLEPTVISMSPSYHAVPHIANTIYNPHLSTDYSFQPTSRSHDRAYLYTWMYPFCFYYHAFRGSSPVLFAFASQDETMCHITC